MNFILLFHIAYISSFMIKLDDINIGDDICKRKKICQKIDMNFVKTLVWRDDMKFVCRKVNRF